MWTLLVTSTIWPSSLFLSGPATKPCFHLGRTVKLTPTMMAKGKCVAQDTVRLHKDVKMMQQDILERLLLAIWPYRMMRWKVQAGKQSKLLVGGDVVTRLQLQSIGATSLSRTLSTLTCIKSSTPGVFLTRTLRDDGLIISASERHEKPR